MSSRLNTRGGNPLITTVGADNFGSPQDDHGDAIDMFLRNDTLVIFTTGEVGPGVVDGQASTSYWIGDTIIPTLNEEDIFIDKHYYNTSFNTLLTERVKIYDGAGKDESRDIRLAASVEGVTTADTEYGSNQLFFCGMFEDSLIQGFDTMTTTFGAGDDDIFIGSTSLRLEDQWFAHEGTGWFNAEESADAIDILDTTLFITGKFNHQVTVSNFWSWTYQNGTSPNYLDGAGPLANYHSLYTIQCKPNGDLIDTTITGPFNTGVNESTDITAFDTALVNSVSNKVVQSFSHRFYDDQNVTHEVIWQNSGTSEALIGRLLPTPLTVGFYKRSRIEHSEESEINNSKLGEVLIYPNPSNGTFSVDFRDGFTGTVSVFDLHGRMLAQKKFEERKALGLSLDVDPGLYLLKLEDEFGGLVTKRVLIQY